MLFNSLAFLIFFPLTLIVYFNSPKKLKWIILLIASCIFYMFFIPYYILILFYLIVTDYIAARLIQKSKGRRRKIYFLISILSNIGTLFLFKYFNFFMDNFNFVAHLTHIQFSATTLRFILPLGLSFHTFQSMSYIIEVYKKRYKAEKNLGIYALYVMFFPQLVAGPIERPKQLLPQLHKNFTFKESRVQEGLVRILIGFFKKLVIADNLAILVNQVYSNPHDYVGLPLVMATIAFSLQIYFDFSGYIDIAIGSAKILGVVMAENFNHPYLATSITDFWRKWNITLYSWFRDYIYIPLGGNRVPFLRQTWNIFFVFALSGLWHGASWTFIAWGALHGTYMATALLLTKTKVLEKIPFALPFPIAKVGKILLTFSLVTFAWIFFRASSFADAFYIITHSFVGVGSVVRAITHLDFYPVYLYLFKQGPGLGISISELIITLIGFLTLEVYEYANYKKKLKTLPVGVRWGIYLGLLLFIVNFELVSRAPFIYFQF